MVPAQACADGPVFKAQQVLHEGGLFEIRALAREGEGSGVSVVELGCIRDDVTEIFVQESVVGFDTDLPFIPSAVSGEACFDVTFTKPIVLENFDRSGLRV